jgi:DnaJ-domain-containing protein 1
MTIVDAAIVVFGLFAGYWVVSKLFFKSAAPGKASLPYNALVPVQEWPQVLQIAPTADSNEIRAAYHRLISQYHPDKVEQFGPELKELAARKSQEITVAYEAALRSKGEHA